jgi:hypothetical protein
MDGALLVLDSRNLPNPHALATMSAQPQSRRNRAVPAFATVILALVLGMVYYVSTQRNPAQPVIDIPPQSAAMTLPSVPQAPSAPAKQVPHTEEPKPAPNKQPATAPGKKASVKTTSTSASTEPKKDDSKVGSLLKKTGRILKKPFKF